MRSPIVRALALTAALSLPTLAAPASAVGAEDPPTPQQTYATTIDLMNRASEADRVARSEGGWSGTIRTVTDSARSRQWRCCSALQRVASRWSTRARDSVYETRYDVDLRRARYRIAATDPNAGIVGTPTRVLLQTKRTPTVRRAVRLAGRPAARWISASAADPVPALVPGELYADSTLGLLPGAAVTQFLGHPRNVLRLERVDTAGSTEYRGSVRRFGAVLSVRFAFRGVELDRMHLSYAGEPPLTASWRYTRPTVAIPLAAHRLGARTFRAAYAFVDLPGLTRELAQWLNRKVPKWFPEGPDREIERFIRFNARNLTRGILGPRFLIITYRYEKLDHGARVAADNRFGTRSRTITWDAQQQRVRLSRVR